MLTIKEFTQRIEDHIKGSLEVNSVYDVINTTFQLERDLRNENSIPQYPQAVRSNPISPTLKSGANKHQIVEYQHRVEEFVNLLKNMPKLQEQYKIDKKLYNDYKDIVCGIVEKMMKEESGFFKYVPESKQSKVWSKAWSEGHSYGHTEVYSYLIDLVELFED